MTRAVDLANSVANGVSLGFKNRIINGAMQIWQRGTSSSTNASFISDRFFMYATSSITGSRSTDVPTGFQYSLSLSGSAYPQIYQRIESNNCSDLVGQTITISFWAKQTVGAGSNSIAYTLYSPTAVDNYTSTNTLGSGSWTGSSSWAYYTVSIANLPASAANGLQLLLYANINGSSTILFTGVQLEVGSTATNFEYRDYGRELIMCQRYLPIINGNTGERFYGVANTTSNCYVSFNYEVEPRVPPTGITVSSVSNFSLFNNRANAGTVAPSNIYFAVAGKMTALLGVTVTGLVANDNLHFYPNSTSAQIRFEGCEL